LVRLQKDEKKNKVDHPPVKGASKDVSDSLAGVCYTLSSAPADEPLPMASGVSYAQDAWMEEQLQSADGIRQRFPDRFYPPVQGGALPVLLGNEDDEKPWV
jgi:hypothetical protein